MKDITVSVDDEPYRVFSVKAAEKGNFSVCFCPSTSHGLGE